MTRPVAENSQITGRARRYGLALEAVTRQYGIGGRHVLYRTAPRHCTFGVHLKDPTKLKAALGLSEELALAAGARVVTATRAGGVILFQFQLAEGLWSWPTRADLEARPGLVGLGIGERVGNRAQVNFEFDQAAPHTGIFGSSGSGKTEAVKSLLCGLLAAYTPDELQVVLLDLKGKYSDFRNAAHLGGLPIAHSEEEIRRALAFVSSELKRREQNSLFDARRLILVADEADAIFTGPHLATGKALVKRGREVGMNAIIATQEPEAEGIRKYMLGQILSRYIGLVDSPQKSYALAGHGGLQAHKLSGRGDFCHLSAGDFRERFVVALATRQDFDAIPRADLTPPDFDDGDPLDPDMLPSAYAGDNNGDLGDWWEDAPEPPEPDRGGRPVKQIEPDILGHYLYFRPENVTPAAARDRLGLNKHMHARYRDYAEAVLKIIRYLKSEGVTL